MVFGCFLDKGTKFDHLHRSCLTESRPQFAENDSEGIWNALVAIQGADPAGELGTSVDIEHAKTFLTAAGYRGDLSHVLEDLDESHDGKISLAEYLLHQYKGQGAKMHLMVQEMHSSNPELANSQELLSEANAKLVVSEATAREAMSREEEAVAAEEAVCIFSPCTCERARAYVTSWVGGS